MYCHSAMWSFQVIIILREIEKKLKLILFIKYYSKIMKFSILDASGRDLGIDYEWPLMMAEYKSWNRLNKQTNKQTNKNDLALGPTILLFVCP